MLYCPRCKNEYQDGYTVCSDCNIMLISYEELNPKLPIYFGEKEEIEMLAEYLEANFIKSVEVKESTDKPGFYEIFADDKEKKAVVKLLKIYLHDKEVKQVQEALHLQEIMNKEAEREDDLEDENLEEDSISEKEQQRISDMEQIHRMLEPAKVHENAKEKAEEYKSTAIMLIIIGILGIAADVMMYLDKLPIHFYGSSKYLSCGLMLALFLVFLGFGFSSLSSSKKLAVIGAKEVDLSEEIKKWMKDNLTAEDIDSKIEIYENDDESVKFFNRTELMKALISSEFEAEEALIDELVDKFYEEIYSE